MDHDRAILGTVSADDLAAEGRTGTGSEVGSPKSRNRSDQILDSIFASERFREWVRSVAEHDAQLRERRGSRPTERAPDRMINMEARRELGTYRGKP